MPHEPENLQGEAGRPAPRPIDDGGARHEAPIVAHDPGTALVPDAPRILVVDDDAESLVAFEAVLRGLGTVVTARSGNEALRRLLDADFAVLLLDVRMPDMDGYETARLIRKRDRHRETPIIFLTAMTASERHVQLGYEAGAVDYVFKPFQPHALRAKVGAFVEMARNRRLLEEEVVRRRRAEAEVMALARGLETRIAERTRELEMANEDLRSQIEVNAQLRRQLEVASRRKDEFLAVLGHELRNPLAAIANASGVLDIVPATAPVASEMRAIVSRQVGRLARLVDDLLDVARITRGTLGLRSEALDLRDVVRRAVDAVAPIVMSRRHELDVRLPPEPVTLTGDPVRLEQVVTNLLDNAAKYTPEGGRLWLRLDVELGSRPRARLSVRDNGPGIAPNVEGQMFELFSRGQNALDGGVAGFGVGLALCRQLVQLHGGSVSMHSSSSGGGSDFVVEIPMNRTPPAPSPAPQPAETPAPSRSVLARRVLIVEDNADAAASLALILRAWGSVAEIAPDGETALASAACSPPDLVLLDLGLPGTDGFEVARRLRAQLGDSVRVVALSGFGSDEDRKHAIASGCNAHLTKPITPERLRSVVMGEVA